MSSADRSAAPPERRPVDATMGKRERNKLDKQRRIIAAATSLFQEKGFVDTTTAEIAARADIGAGTLYLYVESKEDLLVSAFVTVAGDAWAGAFERVDPSAPLLDQLLTVFGHVTDHHTADPQLSRAFFKELPYVGPAARLGTRELVGWFQSELVALLDRAADRGALDPSVPRPVLAENLYAQWQLHMRRLSADALDHDEMLEQLSESVQVALWKLVPESA